MRALIYDPTSPRGLRLGVAPEPEPSASQALVEVHAVSLNFGELAFMDKMRRPGEVPGWDAAGVVVRRAANDAGPPAGTRVCTFGWRGAWAELRAVDTGELAVVPEVVSFEDASALPVAGVTALRAVRRLGPLLGRRVLVTGASGGVGRFAVQLAHAAGAQVAALVGTRARAEKLQELGASEVATALEALDGTFDGVIDTVGGSLLAHAFARVKRGGLLLSVGMASGEASTLDFEAERLRGGDRRIEVFEMGPGLAPDLAYLLARLAEGAVDPQIAWRGRWEDAAHAADLLLGRKINGKAILRVRGGEA